MNIEEQRILQAYAEGKVAPQATAEHMENIHELAKRLQSKAYSHGNADAGSHYSDNYYRAVAAESDEAMGALINACKAIATPPASKAGAGEALAVAVSALKFYADGDHFSLSDPDAWDTVSGEPQNFQCDEAGTATVEDGSLAKLALQEIAGENKAYTEMVARSDAEEGTCSKCSQPWIDHDFGVPEPYCPAAQPLPVAAYDDAQNRIMIAVEDLLKVAGCAAYSETDVLAAYNKIENLVMSVELFKDAERYRFGLTHKAIDPEGFEIGMARVKWNADGSVHSFLWCCTDSHEIDAAIAMQQGEKQ
ncbi:MAG: hypothetical protein JWP38_3722 [Herbaspirillum sp.]|nr:hypothetical protein [Herbaspirillum sp.]